MWTEKGKVNKSANPRDFVDKLDALIKRRIEQQTESMAMDEECELLKREMTDYLLAHSGQSGVYVKGENE